ncbi:MAG: EcsC family protein [Bacillota bacterium]|nr:EcsC family protein [Bacillota bacterium]
MTLTGREKHALKVIKEWENRLMTYEPNDFQITFEKYLERSFRLLPESIQKQFFSVVDSGLFHMNALIQGSQIQLETRERILSTGRIFDHTLEKITDLKNLKLDELQFIAEQQIARHRLYSLVQGSLAGTGKALFLGTDLPAMAIINLRAVQLIGLVYGFEINTPFELMTSLKVFYSAILPPRYQKEAWSDLISEIDFQNHFFYEGIEDITDTPWIEHLLEQLFKAMVILTIRKKEMKGIPLVGLAIGAGTNYRLTKKVTDFANKYYQLRFLQNKEVEI